MPSAPEVGTGLYAEGFVPRMQTSPQEAGLDEQFVPEQIPRQMTPNIYEAAPSRYEPSQLPESVKDIELPSGQTRMDTSLAKFDMPEPDALKSVQTAEQKTQLNDAQKMGALYGSLLGLEIIGQTAAALSLSLIHI